MSAFLSVDLLTDFAAFCLTDFIDWRYIHSWFVISTQLVNCCPHGRRNYTSVLLPLCCTFSLTSPLPNVQYIQTVCDRGWGVLKCTVDHILQEYYTLFLARVRTYKIASPPQTKMTSENDIKGLVSLKFLRPWGEPSLGTWVAIPSLIFGHIHLAGYKTLSFNSASIQSTPPPFWFAILLLCFFLPATLLFSFLSFFHTFINNKWHVRKFNQHK